MLNVKNGKLFPQSNEEFTAILYLLDKDLFCWEYMPPKAKAYVKNMTEEEKNFVKNLLTTQ